MVWRKVLSIVLVALVMVVLCSSFVPVTAASNTTDEILLKRVVVASLDKKGKLQLNITEINQLISFGNATCSCACANSAYSVLKEIYNNSRKNEKSSISEYRGLQ